MVLTLKKKQTCERKNSQGEGGGFEGGPTLYRALSEGPPSVPAVQTIKILKSSFIFHILGPPSLLTKYKSQ